MSTKETHDWNKNTVMKPIITGYMMIKKQNKKLTP